MARHQEIVQYAADGTKEVRFKPVREEPTQKFGRDRKRRVRPSRERGNNTTER